MATKATEKELPPLFRRHVRRPRLTRILDQSKAQSILIIAPAGYGKTTLVAEWLQGKDIGVWYRATNASADVAAFSAGVVEVIQPVAPGAGDRVLQRLRLPEPPERMARVLAELLAEDLQKWPKDKWLVIDDYHLVAESTAVEEFVDALLAACPIRLVVTTRRRPAWGSARRLIYGASTEILRDQLAMTTDEARGLFTPSSSEQTIRGVLERASGWPAVLGLAAVEAAAEAPTPELATTLYRYLAEELLRRLPPELQETLLRISVVPRVTEEYIGSLQLDRGILEDLVDVEALLSRREDGALQVHPLLRDFLLKEFGRRDSDAFVECNQLALGVARTKGWWDDAFETGRRLGPEAAVSVIVDASQHYLAEGRVETLAKWLELVQHEAAISPEAQIVRAEIALRLNRFEEAHSIAAAVADSAPDTDPLSSRAWQLSGQASYWLGAEERALREADRAVAVAHTAADRQRALWHAYLAAQGLELPSVDGYLSALEAESDASSTTRLRVAVGRVIANTRRGTFAGASEVMDRSSALIERESDPWVVSSFLAHWSYVKLSAGQYERAVALAREASTQARNLRLALPLHACLSYLAFAELGRRRFQAADQLHRELTYLAQPFDDPHFALMTRIVGVKLALMRGTRPREELDLPCAAESSKSGTAAELEAVGALAAAVDGDSSLSHEKLARATSLSQGVECFLYCAFTEAVLAQQAHAQSEARRRFVEAIEEARVRECLDALILAYRAWPHLLGLVPEEEAEVRAIIEQALALGADSRLAARYGYRIGGLHPVKSVLTRRENEVLRLMAGGLTNVQIAEKLVISHSTAKVHVSNILRKLGVKNRLEAIRRYESVEP